MGTSISTVLGLFLFCGVIGSLPAIKFQDSRDGTAYQAVKIGHISLMSENLRYEKDGIFCYKGLDRYCKHYGPLYNYETAIGETVELNEDVIGICPDGWHLPSAEEWEYVIKGMKPVIKKNAKGELRYLIPENYAKLQFAGFRSHANDHYFQVGKKGYYLTSTSHHDQWTMVSVVRQNDGYELAIEQDVDKNRSVSCRCVK